VDTLWLGKYRCRWRTPFAWRPWSRR
jgi:hypothetical protein